MTTVEEINTFLDSVIQAANYLRNVVEIPENGPFRDDLFQQIKEADEVINEAADMVNEFDEDEWK